MLKVDTSRLFQAIDCNALHSYAMRQSPLLEDIRSKESEYADVLGWLDIGKWAGSERLDQLVELSGNVRENAEAFVIVGVGGSNNAARSVIEALKTSSGPEVYYFGNTVSAEAVSSLFEKLDGKSVYINVIAKNFETLEPGIGFRVMRKYLKDRYGDVYPSRVFATGSSGSYFEAVCQKNGYTFLCFPHDVGGRFSALCDVGLFPMAVAGVDIRALVDGACTMKTLLSQSEAMDNPAFLYAVVRNYLYGQGYCTELLGMFEPRLSWFAKWWIQLYAESEGKNGKGLFPVASVYSEDLHSVGQFVQDGADGLFETFIQVSDSGYHCILEEDDVDDRFDYLNGKDLDEICHIAYEATLQAHSERRPCLTIWIDRIDAYHFGQMFYFFEYACYLSGLMLGVNPFDQPGVEAYKAHMFRALGK